MIMARPYVMREDGRIRPLAAVGVKDPPHTGNSHSHEWLYLRGEVSDGSA